jgi:uncharacterized protein (DUF1684 family)
MNAFLCLLLGALALAGAPDVASKTDAAYRAAVRQWRAEREARLKADGGWLTVVGLFWLPEGTSRFGTAADCEIVLPGGSTAAVAGSFERAGGRVTLRLEPGVEARLGSQPVAGPLVLRPDTSGKPDVLELGSLSLHVIERGGRYGIRLKDKNSALRRRFAGLDWFEVDEAYRVDARWLAHAQPRTVNVPNVLGQVVPMPSPGYAEFTLGGKTLRLDGVLEEPDAGEIFFILRDGTSGRETYAAGRFLYAPLPQAGRITLDFNKAYSPPCAFTPYATCPLPPPQNWLATRIEAGEKSKGHPVD